MGRASLFPTQKKNQTQTFRCHLALSSLSALAVHIFSFLPARISSAGHQHSFPTGRLCLDIPTPPSVPLQPRRPHHKKIKPNKIKTAPTVFTPLKQKHFFFYFIRNIKLQTFDVAGHCSGTPSISQQMLHGEPFNSVSRSGVPSH